jgi:hypothetical protein
MIDILTAQWQRFLVYGVIVLLACALLELDGYRRGEKKLWDYQAKQATEAVRIVTKRGEVTERVITKYVKVAGETSVRDAVHREGGRALCGKEPWCCLP